MMLEELQRRNYSQTTVNTYVKVVEDFALHFHRPPDEMGKEQIRAYQVHLLKERKLGVRTVGLHTAVAAFLLQDAKETVPGRRGAVSQSRPATNSPLV
jgi:integrase/recombinase XerD